MKYLLKKDKGYATKSFKELNAEALKAAASDIRIKILNELKREPTYPNQLAKKLKMHEQKLYYHINELKNAGLLKIEKTEEIKGSLATYYTVSADSFGIELEGDYDNINIKSEEPEQLKNFFKEYNNNGALNGLIVVGNPIPHGPFKATARDGHYASQLALLIGRLLKPGDFNIRLDTDVINEKKLDENLIIIGGPGTNLVTAHFNKHLPIKFNEENYWTSIKGKQEYTDDSCGLIIKMKNPNNKEKTIIIIAGLRVIGTKASIIAITKQHDELLKNYEQGELARVIKGYDFDGDGKIDGVEILE